MIFNGFPPVALVLSPRLALSLVLICACTSHIAPYRPKKRSYAPGDYSGRSRPTAGSLYRAGAGGLFEDLRGRDVGDVVIVRIDEADAASRDASTSLNRQSKLQASSALPGGIPALDLSAATQNGFQGEGKMERAGRLIATLPVRVTRVMPNGDLYLEGTKVILVNDEEHHLYVSGIVRPEDIGPDDVVLSSRIADAEIEYTGRGVVTDTQRQGWLNRLLNKLSPF